MNTGKSKEDLLAVLEEMKGKTYRYSNSDYFIKDYRFSEEKERVYLITDRREFDRPFDAAFEFLQQFELKVTVTRPQPVPSISRGMDFPERQITGSVIRDLKDVLLDNIKKIQGNKEYIQQAEAVKSNVDSIIELAKTEVEYMSALVKLNKF